MKEYKDALEVVVKELTVDRRYNDCKDIFKSVSYILLGEIYGKTTDQIYEDLTVRLNEEANCAKQERKRRQAEEHEQRRQANIRRRSDTARFVQQLSQVKHRGI
jgi:hypothetical protein